MWTALRRISLTWWIIISMVVGAVFGWLWPTAALQVQPLSSMFLSSIKCLLVPLLFSTLVVGIAGHSDDLKSVGRMAVKAIIYFEIVTTLALVVGLAAVNWVKPGVGVALPAVGTAAGQVKAQKVTFAEIIQHIVPSSFFDAASRNDVLQVVCYTVLFAIALTQVRGKPRETMVAFCESLMEVMFKFVSVVMNFAPFGVGAAIAYTVAKSGLGSLKTLGILVLTLYGALVVFCVFVLWPVAAICRVPVLKFIQAIREPALLAFTTTSSDAAMPDAMKRMIAFGVPKQVVSFVMPLGYSFNLDGSTLHLAVSSIFVAQAAGVDLSLGQQLAIMLTLMVTSKGMAGVPRASQVILAGTLVSFNLPLEGVTLIMAVDTLMDMARTTVNLVGNCLATAVVARWEGVAEPAESESAPPGAAA